MTIGDNNSNKPQVEDGDDDFSGFNVATQVNSDLDRNMRVDAAVSTLHDAMREDEINQNRLSMVAIVIILSAVAGLHHFEGFPVIIDTARSAFTSLKPEQGSSLKRGFTAIFAVFVYGLVEFILPPFIREHTSKTPIARVFARHWVAWAVTRYLFYYAVLVLPIMASFGYAIPPIFPKVDQKTAAGCKRVFEKYECSIRPSSMLLPRDDAHVEALPTLPVNTTTEVVVETAPLSMNASNEDVEFDREVELAMEFQFNKTRDRAWHNSFVCSTHSVMMLWDTFFAEDTYLSDLLFIIPYGAYCATENIRLFRGWWGGSYTVPFIDLYLPGRRMGQDLLLAYNFKRSIVNDVWGRSGTPVVTETRGVRQRFSRGRRTFNGIRNAVAGLSLVSGLFSRGVSATATPAEPVVHSLETSTDSAFAQWFVSWVTLG